MENQENLTGPRTTGPRFNCNGLQIKTVNGQGKGVFTTNPCKTDELILHFTGQVTLSQHISDFTHYLQISPNLYLSPSGQYDDYVNHSCDPNCAVFFQDDDIVLKTIKNIRPEEQLSFDYGTIIFNEPTTFECNCSSGLCRKIIGNFYSMPAELQNKYLKKGMVPLLNKYTREQLGF